MKGDPNAAPFADMLARVARYYSEKLREFGPTARGVDWNSAETQALRFARLLLVVDDNDDPTLNDYGCGYGALLGYLRASGRNWQYCGFDVAEPMIERARTLHAGVDRGSFTVDVSAMAPADFTVASGVFNIRLDHPQAAWHDYVLHTLGVLDLLSRKGFSFNMLSTYSDPARRRGDLYYADPLAVFDHCKRRLSRYVTLLHDYPLYEFTIIVRK